MKNRDIYFKDPTTFQILNQGVAKVSEISQDSDEERARRVQTLRFELETFVCDGEYAKADCPVPTNRSRLFTSVEQCSAIS